MSGKLRRVEPHELPLREELEALAHQYLHLHNELERTQQESSTRRKLDARLLEVRDRFDRVLDEWVTDPDLREQWREYLHNRVPEPAEPRAIEPLVFRGVSDVSGSVVEVRGRSDDFQVWVDGTLAERVAAREDFARIGPPVRFRLNGHEFEETFEVSSEALEARRVSRG
jgi:hypothetical protein